MQFMRGAYQKLVRRGMQACKIYQIYKKILSSKNSCRRKKKFIIQALMNKDVIEHLLSGFFGSCFLGENE